MLRFWKKSLMARLVGSFLLLSLLTVSLVGFVAYIQATEALKLSVFDRLGAVAGIKEGELNRWVDDEARTVTQIAALPEVRAQAQILLRAERSAADYRAAHDALARYLAAFTVNKPELQEIFILRDVGGEIVVSTEPAHEGQYRVSDRYFAEGREGLFVQNVYPSPITLKPTMTVALPLLDEAGQRLGVLAVHLNLQRMDEIIQERTGLGATNEAYLVDRFNDFVSGERFGRQEFPRGVHTAGIDAAVQGQSGAGLYLNYRGVPVIGVYRWIEERELALLVEIQQDEAFAPARRLALTILLVGLASAGLLAVGVYLLARQIARPILAITDTAIQVSAGDLSPSAPVMTDDEIGVLARVFNQMTAQLRALYEGLEHKVDELKRAEAELVIYKDHLEDQVAARTAELQATNEALDQQKQYFESLVQNSPVAIVTTDLDARVVAWNPAAEQLFGYTKAEAVGRNLDELVANEELHAEAAGISQRSAHGDLIHMITRRTRQNRTLVDVELLSVPVVVEGRQVGDIVIYHDITELQRARQEAEQATQAKSAFLATMSHEIRTPMNAIIGMTGLLLDTPLTPQQRDFARTIRSSSDALLTIINDILDFSKIEAGKMELEAAPFDLRDCMETALDLLASRAAEKDLDLACVIEAHVPSAVVGDSTRLRQIMLNLLSNAVKFTDAGEVVLSVAARPLSPGAQGNGHPAPGERYELHFAVRDTGIGIRPDQLDRLFKSFSQVDASTTRKYGGTGLGLAISKRLAELMGGTMWVESEGVPGKGATFHFTIVAPAAESARAVFLRDDQPQLSGRRVLVVDDNATNRQILSLQMQGWGMQPVAVESGAEALELIAAGERFDLAILDMMMPEMDGVMLAEAIRRRREGLPLILLTSLGRSEIGARHLFVALLNKPLKASQLYDALIELFAGDVGQAAGRWRHAAQDGESEFDEHMAERLPLRLLLAEDNTTNQKLALLILERLGYRADVAANGLEALDALRRQPYDLVLMDVQMPEMDGLEATRRIRAEFPPDAQPRIVAMTANAMQGDRELCLAAGMDDYISKPIAVKELVGALGRAQPRVARAVAAAAPPAPVAPPVPPEPTDVIDRAAIRRLQATLGKRAAAMLPALIDSFFKDAARLIAGARKALEQGQAEELRRAAHTLKSNSANFGAQAMAALCQELENRGKAGAFEGAQELVAQIEREYADVQAALERIRKEL